jgi:hypothetical protein
MNYLKFLGLCLCCFLVCTGISAQNIKAPIRGSDPNKPKLFPNLPERIPVEMQEIQNLLADQPEAGRQIDVDLAERKQMTLSGKIVSSSVKYNNSIRTLIIRSSNFSGATLTLSSSIQPDGTVEYSGRIISFQHGDYYKLEKQDNNQYVLIKKNFHELVSD